MSAPKTSDSTYLSNVDQRTPTPGVYRRGTYYRVLTRPDGKRKVMHRFATYEEAVAFKAGTPNRETRKTRAVKKPRQPRENERKVFVALLRGDPCCYCSAPTEHIDHIVPRAVGGDNDWTNLTASCARCNSAKKDKPLLVFLAHEHGCYEWRRDRDALEQPEPVDEPAGPLFDLLDLI